MICLKLQFLSLMWALAPSSPEELCSPRWPWLAEVVKINSSLTNCRLAGTSFCVLRQNPARPNSPNCPVVRHKSNTRRQRRRVKRSKLCWTWVLERDQDIDIGSSKLDNVWRLEVYSRAWTSTAALLTPPPILLLMSGFNKSSVELSSLKAAMLIKVRRVCNVWRTGI